MILGKNYIDQNACLHKQLYSLILFTVLAHMLTNDLYEREQNQNSIPSAPNDPMSAMQTSFIVVSEARVVGRMARMWYIKKQIKKLNKKLQGTTIMLPIVTRIPIYDHAYYPASQVTEISEEPLVDQQQANYYPQPVSYPQSQEQPQYYITSQGPTIRQTTQQQQPTTIQTQPQSQTQQQTTKQQTKVQSPQTAASNPTTAIIKTTNQQQQQVQQVQPSASTASQGDLSMAVSASQPHYQYAPMLQPTNRYPVAMMQHGPYRRPYEPQKSMYQPHYSRTRQQQHYPMPVYRPNNHQYINNYQPSPPSYYDQSDDLYGRYGNAYGRYDGGYHMVF